MSKQSFGLIGLAVMGENLALNVERNGFPIAVYNRSREKLIISWQPGPLAKTSSPPLDR
jgi:6-phosphogluconate dehydrogenase